MSPFAGSIHLWRLHQRMCKGRPLDRSLVHPQSEVLLLAELTRWRVLHGLCDNPTCSTKPMKHYTRYCLCPKRGITVAFRRFARGGSCFQDEPRSRFFFMVSIVSRTEPLQP